MHTWDADFSNMLLSMLQWVYWQAHWVWAYQWQQQAYTPEDRAFLTYKVHAMLFTVLVWDGDDVADSPLRCGTVPSSRTSAAALHGMQAGVQQPECQCRRSSGRSPFGRGCQRLSGMSWRHWGCGSGMPWSLSGGKSNRGENTFLTTPEHGAMCHAGACATATSQVQALHHHTPSEAAAAAGGAGCRRWSAFKARGWMTPGQQLAMSEEQSKQRLADSRRRWTAHIHRLPATAQATLHLIYSMRHEYWQKPYDWRCTCFMKVSLQVRHSKEYCLRSYGHAAADTLHSFRLHSSRFNMLAH
jgi:hypothetical protein